MTGRADNVHSLDLAVLLRGEPASLRASVEGVSVRRLGFYLAVVFIGAGLYGAAMGWWRSPTQGFYVAVKFPLILLLTGVGNSLLNAMLAPLLGLNIGFRQALFAILISFAIAGAILGGFSPLIAFLVWNAPPMTTDTALVQTPYNLIKLTHVLAIAFAGTAANLRLVQLLRELSGSLGIARRVLWAWLVGNLFLGSQLCWILRPFIGSPDLPVQFLRPTAFQGNFYENVFHSFLSLFDVR